MWKLRGGFGMGWSRTRATVVVHETEYAYKMEGNAVGRRLWVRASWSSRSPFEVTLVFSDPKFRLRNPNAAEWVVARDLLVAGGGQGDIVLVSEFGGSPRLELTSPSGHAVIEVPDEFLYDFLDEIEEIMPRGTEPLSEWLSDGALAELVRGDW